MSASTPTRPPQEIAPPATDQFTPDELERGWRIVPITLPDGRSSFKHIPLTPADFLNPQEGDVIPQSTFHDRVIDALRSILELRYGVNRLFTIFHDLIMDWGIPGLPNPSPDIAVVPNVQAPERNRGCFYVMEEGTRPVLVIEVVSPLYRKQDREDKVQIYADAGIAEYVILDERQQRGQTIDEALGYSLIRPGAYRPIAPNEDGFILCRTIGVWIGLESGQGVVIDAATNERLKTRKEEQAARLEAEARAEAEAAARQEAEARLAALEAELKRLRGDVEGADRA